MVTKLNETLTFSPSVVVPNDGEPVLASNMVDAVQPLANRTRYLRQRVDVDGIERIRRVESLTLLAEIPSPADRSLAAVANLGLYEFVALSPFPASAPWVVAPTTGTGRWIHTLALLRDSRFGLATLDNASRVAAARVRNGILFHDYRNAPLLGSAFQPLTELGPVTLPGSTIVVPAVQDGDRIEVTASVLLAGSGSGTSARVELFAGSPPQLVSYAFSIGAGTPDFASSPSLVGTYACTVADESAGSVTVLVKATDFGKASAGFRVTGTLGGMHVRHIRP